MYIVYTYPLYFKNTQENTRKSIVGISLISCHIIKNVTQTDNIRTDTTASNTNHVQQCFTKLIVNHHQFIYYYSTDAMERSRLHTMPKHTYALHIYNMCTTYLLR